MTDDDNFDALVDDVIADIRPRLSGKPWAVGVAALSEVLMGMISTTEQYHLVHLAIELAEDSIEFDGNKL